MGKILEFKREDVQEEHLNNQTSDIENQLKRTLDEIIKFRKIAEEFLIRNQPVPDFISNIIKTNADILEDNVDIFVDIIKKSSIDIEAFKKEYKKIIRN